MGEEVPGGPSATCRKAPHPPGVALQAWLISHSHAPVFCPQDQLAGLPVHPQEVDICPREGFPKHLGLLCLLALSALFQKASRR